MKAFLALAIITSFGLNAQNILESREADPTIELKKLLILDDGEKPSLNKIKDFLDRHPHLDLTHETLTPTDWSRAFPDSQNSNDTEGVIISAFRDSSTPSSIQPSASKEEQHKILKDLSLNEFFLRSSFYYETEDGFPSQEQMDVMELLAKRGSYLGSRSFQKNPGWIGSKDADSLRKLKRIIKISHPENRGKKIDEERKAASEGSYSSAHQIRRYIPKDEKLGSLGLELIQNYTTEASSIPYKAPSPSEAARLSEIFSILEVLEDRGADLDVQVDSENSMTGLESSLAEESLHFTSQPEAFKKLVGMVPNVNRRFNPYGRTLIADFFSQQEHRFQQLGDYGLKPAEAVANLKANLEVLLKNGANLRVPDFMKRPQLEVERNSAVIKLARDLQNGMDFEAAWKKNEKDIKKYAETGWKYEEGDTSYPEIADHLTKFQSLDTFILYIEGFGDLNDPENSNFDELEELIDSPSFDPCLVGRNTKTAKQMLTELLAVTTNTGSKQRFVYLLDKATKLEMSANSCRFDESGRAKSLSH
ncbi:hypothetical protein GW915_12370 [bacterium]|nr:hypothetical protein [bacterium]